MHNPMNDVRRLYVCEAESGFTYAARTLQDAIDWRPPEPVHVSVFNREGKDWTKTEEFDL